MMRIKNFVNSLPAVFFVLLINGLVFISCPFDATRDNQFDPGGDNSAQAMQILLGDGGWLPPPDITVSQGSQNISFNGAYNFAGENVGTSGPAMIFDIMNSGADVFKIVDVSLSSGDMNDFTLETQNIVNDLPPGGQTQFGIRFSPQTSGEKRAVVTIGNLNPAESDFVFTVTGTANTGTVYDKYVSAQSGSDDNDGSMNNPYATIEYAMGFTNAGAKIAVAQGTYNISASLVLQGREIYGGFAETAKNSRAINWDDGARSPSGYPTIISYTGTSGGTESAPTSAIKVEGDASNQTVIDGFEITGGSITADNPYSCAIYVDTDTVSSYQLLIKNNKINGGESTYSGLNLIGIYIRSNTTGGTYTITIERNEIVAGTGNSDVQTSMCYGIYASSMAAMQDTTTLNIWNNTIDGGRSIAGTTAYTYGIVLENFAKSSVLIYNNTIDGGDSANLSCGIKLGANDESSSYKPSIINNIIFTSAGISTYGIYEEVVNSDPNIVENNCVFECADALYYDHDIDSATAGWGLLDSVEIPQSTMGNFYNSAQSEYLTTPTGAYNTATNPSFEDQNIGNWHLTVTTMDEVKKGGKDLSSSFTTDKDGNPRTNPWSMGAFEQDN